VFRNKEGKGRKTDHVFGRLGSASHKEKGKEHAFLPSALKQEKEKEKSSTKIQSLTAFSPC